jgi:hypothetical protein
MKFERKRRLSIHSLLLSTLLLNSVYNVTSSNESQFQAQPINSNNNINRIRGAKDVEDVNNISEIRTHPIRRIYGADNAAVRDEVHKIETESSHYWRTGMRADPTFEVDYIDHPYDPKRRRLQNENNQNRMKPMRVKTVTTALQEQENISNKAKIAFIIDEILPRMTKFWSEALSVVPVNGNLRMQGNDLISGYCGDSEFSEVPDEHLYQGVPDTDIILYISGTPSTRFCGPTTLAVAVACNWDQYDRPTAGAINFCVEQVKLDSSGSAQPAVIEDNVDVAIHEAGHVLGMSSNSYRYFWNPSTGKPRTARPIKARSVTCVDGSTKTTYVPDENTLQFLTNSKGVRAATIVTEKVKAVAQNHFNCTNLEGGQLEVSFLFS